MGRTKSRKALALVSSHADPFAKPGAGNAGGLSVAVSHLAFGFSRQGVPVDVYVRSDQPHASVRHLAHGLRLLTLPTSRFLHGGRMHVLDSLRPSGIRIPRRYLAIHSHYWSSVDLAAALRENGEAMWLHTAHTLASVKDAIGPSNLKPQAARRYATERLIAEQADVLLAATSAEAEALARIGGRARTRVVTPAAPAAYFRPRHDHSPAARGSRPLELLLVGRIHPDKNLQLAIRALHVVRSAGVSARLRVIGGPSGPQGAAELALARHLVRRLGLERDVRFDGRLDAMRVAAAIAAADALLVTSWSESFGIAALEALRSGTPVVGTAVGVLPQALHNGGGAVVAEHSPASVAAALLTVLDDPPRARRRAAAAAAEEFTFARVIRGHGDAYGLSPARPTN